MGNLQIGLFGNVRVSHDDWNTEIPLTRENQGLLAYLLLQRRKVHSREVLADLFWGEHSQERARGSLNTALWKLKKALEPMGIPAGTYLKKSDLGDVGFNKDSQYWLDVEIFEEGLNRILIRPFQTIEASHLVELETLLRLYKGDLLEGFYKDWALQERERLRTLYLKSLIYLLQYHKFYGEYEKAIAYGQQVLILDPLREEIHRELMRLYVENGQRTLAVRQYEVCRATLAKEMDITPMEDTQRLYTQIITVGNKPHISVLLQDAVTLDQAVQQLREANQTIDLVKEKIQQVLQLIAKS
jgi:DNA-binding SARP family transcriptional activator